MTGDAAPYAEMSWDHPHLGRIVEIVCPDHEREVLRALEALGIGCTGRPYSNGDEPCGRCINRRVRPRAWLRAKAVQ